jgi:hypothetical protein
MMRDSERCEVICKKDGKRCRAPAMMGKKTCVFHSPGQEKQAREARSRGGKNAHVPRIIPTTATPEVQLETLQDVSRLLATTINEVRRGLLDVRVGNCVAALATCLAKTLQDAEESEIAVQLEELKRLVGSRPVVAAANGHGILALTMQPETVREVIRNEPPQDSVDSGRAVIA